MPTLAGLVAQVTRTLRHNDMDRTRGAADRGVSDSCRKSAGLQADTDRPEGAGTSDL